MSLCNIHVSHLCAVEMLLEVRIHSKGQNVGKGRKSNTDTMLSWKL